MSDEFSELMELAQDLGDAGAGVSGFVRKAVQVTSHNIKEAAQTSVRGRKELGHAAQAIDYDVTERAGAGIDSEIGYDKERPAGKLGNLIEFGAPNAGNQLTPSHDLGNALLNNEDDFVYGLERAVADALEANEL